MDDEVSLLGNELVMCIFATSIVSMGFLRGHYRRIQVYLQSVNYFHAHHPMSASVNSSYIEALFYIKTRHTLYY